VAQPERPAPRSGSSSARRARLRSSRSRLHIRSLRRSLASFGSETTRGSRPRRAGWTGTLRSPPENQLGPPPPSGSGSAVKRSGLYDQMRRLDSPWASLNGDAPVEPLGDGRSPLFGEACLPREEVARIPRRSFGRSPTHRSEVLFRIGWRCGHFVYDLRVLTLEQIGTDKVDTAESAHPVRPGTLRSNSRAS
jgi:hypothetical protein